MMCLIHIIIHSIGCEYLRSAYAMSIQSRAIFGHFWDIPHYEPGYFLSVSVGVTGEGSGDGIRLVKALKGHLRVLLWNV